MVLLGSLDEHMCIRVRLRVYKLSRNVVRDVWDTAQIKLYKSDGAVIGLLYLRKPCVSDLLLEHLNLLGIDAHLELIV